MIIDIKEKFNLFGRSYRISVNGNSIYRAKNPFFSFLPTIRLYQEKQMKITMIKELGYEVDNYDIILSDGSELEFKNISKKEEVYTCRVQDNFYHIYANRGNRVQVFENDHLIAGWEQNDVRFADHEYQIRGDKDFDAELIICFCLICDQLKSIKRKTSV